MEENREDADNEKEMKMANKNLILKLTPDQKRQIKEATGKQISELKIDLGSTGQLSEKDLEQVAGGATKKKVSYQ